MSWVNDLGEFVKDNNIVDRISTAVNALAQKLGVAAVHVYEVFTKQVIAESIAHIIMYIIIFCVIVLCAYIFVKMRKNAIWESKTGDPKNAEALAQFIAIVVMAITFVIGGLYFIFTVTDTVTGLINPEYRVIHEIANMINPSSNNQQK